MFILLIIDLKILNTKLIATQEETIMLFSARLMPSAVQETLKKA